MNKDYEPYARSRDSKIEKLLFSNSVEFLSFKDQVIHEENEVLKKDGTPYTVFTPYKNKWLEVYKPNSPTNFISYKSFFQKAIPFPDLQELGFKRSSKKVRDYDLSQIHTYSETRDFPCIDSTSYLSPHLRFGTVSVRSV